MRTMPFEARSCMPLVQTTIASKTMRATVAMAASRTISIGSKFNQLREKRKVALIPYVTAGDPSLEMTAEALKFLDSYGADIIELGVPYSNPVLDGPVLQAAATRALKNGTNLDSVLSMVHDIAPTLQAPLVLFSYYNLILERGIEVFTKKIKDASVSGLIVPDVPFEQTDALRKYTQDNNIELVLLTTPTTPKARMQQIAESSQGFVYLVSHTGVTGARSSLNVKLEELIKELKKVTDKPIAVGFGISRAEHVSQLKKWGADGVIVGTAIVKVLAESGNGLQDVGTFVSGLRNAL